ncbi:glycosyltransferase family 2 protein [Belnapia sp. T6]|uniref:Glycosyltransferase family 2 protein n=1 Tax=Belnapia mucosa TaxID=2804532 RepID=A0ABS1UZX8_9PROT|nr:glycosyltransferase family 2 protein [Belnapia mucosa]MBL6455005.1 glycosyltransferase family 2 protein [Belnapia mucosa]
MSGPRMTVVFATRDRATLLPRVLDRFAELQSPPGGWSLVVVDNGSRDRTVEVLRSYTDRLPLTALSCPQPGKNRALNAALQHLQGDLAVFTDDDVLPEPDWLVRLRAAADSHPEADLFGGTVLPDWPQPKPDWLCERAVEFSVLYAQQRRPSGACGFADIFGPNMAVRSAIFAAGTRFAEHVGPDDTNPLYAMGSETELLRRLEGAGHRGWFEASACVRHIIRPEQMEERWILNRAFRYGVGEGRHYAGRRSVGLLVRRLVYGIAARGSALLPPSPRRLRIRYRDRWLAGVAAGRPAARASPPSG